MPRSGREQGFTLIEILIVISIIAILMSMVVGGVMYARAQANIAVAGSFVQALSNGLDNFYQDEGYFPGGKVDPDENAFPELFEALLGEPRPKGEGGRSAPYVEVKLENIWIKDEDTGDYRQVSGDERWDPDVPKYVLDPWGSPYWYRNNKARERAGYMKKPFKADIWSLGPDKVNSSVPGAEEGKSDDIGNW